MADRPILFSAPMVRALLDGRKTQTRRILKARPSWGNIPQSATWRFSSGYKTTKADPPWMEATVPTSYGATQILANARVAARISDRLWVREAFQEFLASEFPPGRTFGPRGEFGIPAERAKGNVSYVAYRADGDFPPHPVEGKAVWRSSIHMPRKFSRLTLTVTDVRVQRLQDISEEDAIAEGIVCQNVIIGMACYGGPPCEITADRYYFDGCDDEGFEDEVSAYAALWDSINGVGAWEQNPWIVAYSFEVERRNIDAEVPHDL